MSVESQIARSLDIRIVEARTFAKEARNKLGIAGQLNKKQSKKVLQEAVKIFERRPESVKIAMRRLRYGSETMDVSVHSTGHNLNDTSHSYDGSSDGSDF